MRIDVLLRNLRTARHMLDAIVAGERDADPRTTITEVHRRLARAVESLDELRDELFQLQEQNQQLRRDLSNRVCPRLCAHGRGCAS